jgi:hypothetical protein
VAAAAIEAALMAERRAGIYYPSGRYWDGALPDATAKFLTIDHHDRVNGFLLVSSPRAPFMVERGVLRARAIAGMLPGGLAEVVLLPMHTGSYLQRTYALYPIRRPVAGGALASRWEQFRFGGRVIDWLDQAVVASKRACSTGDVESRFVSPLTSVTQNVQLPASMRSLAARSLSLLEDGQWKPFNTLMHNDFWWGNVVFSPPEDSAGFGFQIVDWAGSQPAGYPFFDLLRMHQSLKVKPGALDHHIARHARLLECDMAEAAAYLVTALGYLGETLEHFPYDRYLESARSIWSQFTANTQAF